MYMDSATLVVTVLASVLGGGTAGSLVTAFFTRKKTGAEAEATLSTAILAYTNKLTIDNDKLRTDFDRMQEIDLRGTWLSVVGFARPMLTRHKGSVVTIASITGMRSVAPHSYAAAKAGVISLTTSLAADWGRSGIRVNCVSPGYTLTPLLKSLIERKERDPTNMQGDTAMGRLVESDEIGRTVAFLASDEASAITGVNIPVDCGWLVGTSWHTYGGIRPAR